MYRTPDEILEAEALGVTFTDGIHMGGSGGTPPPPPPPPTPPSPPDVGGRKPAKR